MRTIVNAKRPTGFTLIELSIVILIIGILLSFLLVAGAAGLESARVRATQALITKLNAGLEERMEAILASQAAPNGAHQFIASINPPGTAAGASPLPWGISGADQRAAVIARLDQIRAEFPDVFFIRPDLTGGGGSFGLYPVQFAGVPYPNPADATNPESNNAQYAAYILPLGNSVTPGYNPDPSYVPANPINPAYSTGPGAAIGGPGTGINGASYAAAAALYKLIGYTAKGCDGVDNNGNGFVDEFLEGMSDPADNSGANGQAKATFDKFVANHQHKTARAEMLYALLVNGVGPFGNVFNAEDFRSNEVQDTDNDGVPEFVDGWGEPLQFYRWPVAYRSDLQKGESPYDNAAEPRQINPLDQNKQLLNIAWWSTNDATNIGTPSQKALGIQSYFGPLTDPNWIKGTPNGGLMWDRSGATGRRAYFSKFLIVSGGPDREVGIPRMSDGFVRNSGTSLFTLSQAANGSVTYTGTAFTFVAGEGWGTALPWGDPVAAQMLLPAWATSPYEPYLDRDYAADDLSNQQLQNQAGGFR